MLIAEMASLRAAIVALSIVQCLCLKTRPSSDEIRFDGDDFVSFNLTQRRRLHALGEHKLSFEFKTIHPSGMLVYIGSEFEKGDFLMVDLFRGKLR